MQLRIALLIVVASLAAACGRPPQPVTDVRPVVGAPRVAMDPVVAPPAAGEVDSLAIPAAALDSIRTGLESVVEQVFAVFADSTVIEAVTAEPPSADSVAGPVTWDIDVRSYVTHDRVEFYVSRFTGSARDRIRSWMQRGRRFEPMIRQTFRDAGIPEDMYYLGLVESGYDPHAYSRAAAVGIWQFMTATARGMGLRVDWWVDERRDPIRSTWAAARFLGALRDQFGSLYLAAAAYNGGPGRVARGLNRHATALEDTEGDDRFFALVDRRVFRTETSNYVPQLIAAALIGKDPQKYGIKLEPAEPFAYDSVRVAEATPVVAVARAAGVGIEAVRDLNPHLLRGITPPGDSAWIRIPTGTVTAFAEGFVAMDDSVRRAFDRVKAKKGATVAGMAKGAGLTVSQLRWFNPKLKGAKIATGTVVLVPTRTAVRGAFDVPDPAVERYGTSANGVHVVRRGETLSHFARRYGTSVQTLVRLNHLKKNVIYAGQSIIVRASATRSRPAATRPSTASRSQTPQVPPKPNH
jgi:membrane-bound lytic murein transglycosylase D